METKQKIPSPLSAADIIRLFEYEMKYPISIILQFREVAFAVFYAQELFQRKKNAANKSMASSNQGSSRRLSSAAPPRASLTGSGSTGNPLNSLDFQQAMSWSHVLHMITILRDEQKGIATEVSHNEDEGLNIIAPALSTVATSNLKSSSEDSIRKNFESKKDESKVKDEPKVETPVKTPVQETPTTPSEDPPVKSDDSKRVEGQDGKKISLGISLKKGGPPVEMSVPILKTSSKTASSLFSSMKQGLEQLGLDSGNRDRDMDQSRSTPSKKTPIVEPENKPVVISQELFSEVFLMLHPCFHDFI